ncbi:hypothetical protein YC2023_123364 [Brassica napus]
MLFLFRALRFFSSPCNHSRWFSSDICPSKPPDLAPCSPHIEAPSLGCPPDLPDVVFFKALLCFFDTFFKLSLQTFTQISTLKLPSRMTTKNDGGGGLISHVIYRFLFGCVDWPSISFCFDIHAIPPHKVEEKLIVIFSPMNMDVAGYDFPLVPRLNQSLFVIFSLIWDELNEQALLISQGSSSHLTLFSAYGAVCMILRVILDVIFQEAYGVVMI